MDIVFHINEGPRYKVKDVQLVGATQFSDERIRSVTKLKPGDTYDGNVVQADQKNIQDLYGVSAVSPEKTIDLVVRLEKWNPRKAYDRLGLNRETEAILDLEVPLLRLPVAPGRNVALLVELAAKNLLLRARGHDATATLLSRVEAQAGPPREGKP